MNTPYMDSMGTNGLGLVVWGPVVFGFFPRGTRQVTIPFIRESQESPNISGT